MTVQDSASDKNLLLLKHTPDVPLPDGVELYRDEEKLHLYVKFLNGPVDSEIRAAAAEAVLETLNSLDVRNLDAAAVATAAGRNPEEEPVLIASGRPPRHGVDGRIEYKFDTEGDTKVTFHEDQRGRVNFRKIDLITQVKEGDVVAEIVDPTAGQHGEDVFGNTIPAHPGEHVKYKSRLGANVLLDGSERKAVAKVSGLVTLDKGRIVVRPLYKINGDVNFETGNIEFDGEVVINGFVREDFRVEATGSVQVVKNIERATVVAGKDICVGGGIVGKRGVQVVAGQKIRASYANNAMLRASESICIIKEMVHSVARAPSVFLHGSPGAVLGGEIHATRCIDIKRAGDPDSWVRTIIEIEDEREIMQQIKARQQRLAQLEKEYNEAKIVCKRLGNIGKQKSRGLSKLAVAKIEMMGKLMHTVREQQSELNSEIASLEEKLQQPDELKVDVQGNLYPGSRILILGAALEVSEPMGGCTFMLVDNELKQVHSR